MVKKKGIKYPINTLYWLHDEIIYLGYIELNKIQPLKLISPVSFHVLT